ncbi:MAG TPA: DUF1376 domain-containing protein [Candidatus Binatia bacterium]|nr:DUF1376 domain-containing protein [Candidatus Binatia bacterium]
MSEDSTRGKRGSRLQKPEWFRLDPAKFLSDSLVDAMTTEELGAALRLLCRQWLDGFIPDDLSLLARLCRLDDERMRTAWKTLSSFFPVIAEGKRANRFMFVERASVVAELERRTDQATKAARKRWEETQSDATAMLPACSEHADSNAQRTKRIAPSMLAAMQEKSRADTEQSRAETEKTSSSSQKRSDEELFPSEPTKEKKNSPKEPSDEGKKLAALLRTEILRNKPDFRVPPNLESSWGLIADRMVRIDQRDPEVIASIIRWSQRDEFWRANVLSMKKLREKFDQLQIKSEITSGPPRPKPVAIAAPAVILKANPAVDALLKSKSLEQLEKPARGTK